MSEFEAVLKKGGKATRGGQSTARAVGCTAVAVVAAVLAIGVLMSGFTVQAGYVGVVTTFGAVEPGVLQPGFHLRVPFVNQIHQIDVRVQPHNFNEIEAASLEQQTVRLTGTMNYRLDRARANELYANVGLDFATKVIDPAFSDYIKEVVPRYRANELLQRRDEIRQATKEKLTSNLQQYGIIVNDIYISNIAFSPEYQQAIEQKQTQQQNVGREEQVLAQKQIQAQQLVAQAKGEADAAIERARGEAESNRVRAQSVTPELIEYLQTTKWDGRLPQVTSGGVPLISLGGAGAADSPGASQDSQTAPAPAAAPARPAPTAVPARPSPTPAASPTAGR